MRAYIFIISLFVIYLALTFQLVRVQILEHDKYSRLAQSQHYQRVEIPASRGLILDRHGKPLAQSVEVSSICANPQEVEDKEAAAKKLAKALGLKPSPLLEVLKRDKKFVWVKRGVGPKEAQAVKELGFSGIETRQETRRTYPCGRLLSHVIGFVDIDERGLEGIESSFDKELSGQPSYRVVARDALQRPIFSTQDISTPPMHGHDVILTVDITLQHILEEELDKAIQMWKPGSATAIAMEPATGEVLAMANRPTYDPNFFATSTPEERRNRAITDCYEPGSIIKPLVVSGVLKRKLVRPEDVFFCNNGSFQVGRRVLRDVHPYGNLTVEEIVIHSSNIGMAKLAMLEGQKRLYDNLRGFGLGEPTAIELPGEVSGTLRNPRDWTSYSLGSIAMGYEVTVTPLQIVSAFCAIANGGTFLKPRVVKAIAQREGGAKKTFQPQPRHKVLPDNLAREVIIPILTKVVKEGTGRKADLQEYAVAGKTGTSRKVLEGAKGYGGGYVSSFVGFAPAEAPRLCVLVMINGPRGDAYYGGTVAAPVVREILRRSLNYLERGAHLTLYHHGAGPCMG